MATAIHTIKNLFNGINPHLLSKFQTEGNWISFHASHIVHMTTSMKQRLRPLGYTADVEQSLQIRRVGDSLNVPRSDVIIYDRMTSHSRISHISPSAQEIALPIPTLLGVRDEEDLHYSAIVIHELLPNTNEKGDPVAWIELLSPTNKPDGGHFELYNEKRTKLLQSGLVFIEIDYLHHYPPTFPALIVDKEWKPYRIAVIDPRPEFWEGEGRIREFNVDELIPSIKIPLNAGDILEFDFDAVYQQTYTEMFYGDEVDYGQLPANFERYGKYDKMRIVGRLLGIRDAQEQGQDLEVKEIVAVEITLEQGLERLSR